MTSEFLQAFDDLLQAFAETQQRGTKRQLAEVYDERTMDRMLNEAVATARGLRTKAEDRRKKARDAQAARAAQAARQRPR